MTSGRRGALGTAAERRQSVQQRKCERPEGFCVARGCRAMKVARSTYYYRSRRAAAREKALRERIVAVCEEFPRYGYRRVTHQLRAEGMSINHKAVARIMRESGLQVRPLRRFVRT